MIASLSGSVQASGAGWVVVSVGGVGLRAEVPSGRASVLNVGEEVFLWTSLVVREDSLTLYGFSSEEELLTFEQLIAVNGVGPRSALGVLSELEPAEVARAVAAEDDKPFRKVSGIGPKTAKLIVLSLQGKLAAIETRGSAAGGEASAKASDSAVADAVRDGLIGLGWKEPDAARAVEDAIAAGAPEEHAGLLRAALTLLQSARTPTRGGVR